MCVWGRAEGVRATVQSRCNAEAAETVVSVNTRTGRLRAHPRTSVWVVEGPEPCGGRRRSGCVRVARFLGTMRGWSGRCGSALSPRLLLAVGGGSLWVSAGGGASQGHRQAVHPVSGARSSRSPSAAHWQPADPRRARGASSRLHACLVAALVEIGRPCAVAPARAARRPRRDCRPRRDTPARAYSRRDCRLRLPATRPPATAAHDDTLVPTPARTCPRWAIVALARVAEPSALGRWRASRAATGTCKALVHTPMRASAG